MNTSTGQTKPSFYDICTVHKYTRRNLQKLATASGVSQSIIEAMCNGTAIARSDAEKVLAAFSQFTRREWTLKNVHIRLLPTFADLYELHHDALLLPKPTDFALALVIEQMLCGEKVAKNDATAVLEILSQQTGHSYTLENVAVQLRDGEVQHA